MERRQFFVSNGEGWDLGLIRFWDDETLCSERRPLAIIPGYGMNGFIFSYHPRGRSMAESLVAQGFEVWVVNLRGQEPSRCQGGDKEYRLRDLAVTDLDVATKLILAQTKSTAGQIDLIGASLGATIVFLHLALSENTRIGAVVSFGGPLRWVDVHPARRYSFGIPAIARWLPTRGTRALAAFALPKLRHLPFLLSIYLHPNLVDLSAADQLVKTVEDPNRTLNLEISRWVRDGDLQVDGVNLTTAMGDVTNPLLCVVANGDGIVPPKTALSIMSASGATLKETLWVGDQAQKWAHADMFIANQAEKQVFEPLGKWLSARYDDI